MKFFNLDEVNKIAAFLTEGQISNLTDDQINELATDRPAHPGQKGFML